MEVTSQSYIAFFAILYSSPHIPTQYMRPLCKTISSLLVPSSLENRSRRLRSSKEERVSCEEMALRNGRK